jgi:hypothetical protein
MANELTANSGVLSEGTEAPVPDGSTTSNQAMGSQTPALPVSPAGGLGYHLMPRPYTLTIPPPDDYYFVRADQLDGLTHQARDYSIDIALGAGGAAIGFCQNVLSVIKDVYKGDPVDSIDLVLAALAIGLAVLAVTKFLQFRHNQRSVDTLKAKIQSGQKATVSGGE